MTRKNQLEPSVKINQLCRIYHKEHCIFYYNLEIVCYTLFMLVKIYNKLL